MNVFDEIRTKVNDATEINDFLPGVTIAWKTSKGYRCYNPTGKGQANAPMPIPGMYWEQATKPMYFVNPGHKNYDWRGNEWLKVPYVRYFEDAEALYIGARYLKIVRPAWDKKAPFEPREWQKLMSGLRTKMTYYGTEGDYYESYKDYNRECIVFKSEPNKAYNLYGGVIDEGKYYSEYATHLMKGLVGGACQFYNGWYDGREGNDKIFLELDKFITEKSNKRFSDRSDHFKATLKDLSCKKAGKTNPSKTMAKNKERLEDLCKAYVGKITPSEADKLCDFSVTYHTEVSTWSSYTWEVMEKVENKFINVLEGDWLRIFERRFNTGLLPRTSVSNTLKPQYGIVEVYRIYIGEKTPAIFERTVFNGVTNWSKVKSIAGTRKNVTIYNQGLPFDANSLDDIEIYYKKPERFAVVSRWPKLYQNSYTHDEAIVESIIGEIKKPTKKALKNANGDYITAMYTSDMIKKIDYVNNLYDGQRTSLLIYLAVDNYDEAYKLIETISNRKGWNHKKTIGSLMNNPGFFDMVHVVKQDYYIDLFKNNIAKGLSYLSDEKKLNAWIDHTLV